MTDQPVPAAHDAAAEHDAATHTDAHATLSDDDHGHTHSALGPIDWPAWGLAIVGALAGALVLAGFWLALG